MLTLSRKKNESIVINNDIIVTVVEVRGDKVRLSIVAPRDVPVHRQEVFEAIHGRVPWLAETTHHGLLPDGLGTTIREADYGPARVEMSVGELIHELGAADVDVDRHSRFTSEGGIVSANAPRETLAVLKERAQSLVNKLLRKLNREKLQKLTKILAALNDWLD